MDGQMAASNDSDLIRQQRDTEENSRIRQEIHNTYTVPQINYPEWVVTVFQWQGDERVLDVGCGSGLYHDALAAHWPDIQYCGLDLSWKMLRSHTAQTRVSVGNAQYLPFADHSFDVVMANHMLFYVADIESAILEFRRVLRPGGALMAATNSINNMAELQVLLRRAILLLARTDSGRIQTPLPISALFGLENGARMLARHFFSVARYDLPSHLLFTEIEPLMRYIETTRYSQESQLPDDVAWEDVMMIMQQQIHHLINHLGELAISKLSGVLVASDTGGAVREFVHLQGNSKNAKPGA